MGDERKTCELGLPTGPTRRQIITLAGGLALAASGLFLPEASEDAGARDSVLGGAKGGRHGRNHKGRHRRRTHGSEKNNEKHDDRSQAKDHEPFRSSAVTVINRWPPPLECTFYYQIKTGLDSYAPPVADGDRTILYNESFRYDPDRYRVGVLIRHTPGWQDVYADMRNVSLWFPRGSVVDGDNLDPHSGMDGHILINEQDFSQRETQRDGYFTLTRKDDSKDRIEWEFVVRDPLG